MPVVNHVDIFVEGISDIVGEIRFRKDHKTYFSISLDRKTTLYFRNRDDLELFIKVIQNGLEGMK